MAGELAATEWQVHVPSVDPRLKIGVLVSWQDHVLLDLLNRWQCAPSPKAQTPKPYPYLW